MRRRQFLARIGGAAAGSGLSAMLQARQAPSLGRAAGSVPAVPGGVASGDVTEGRATIWSRTDRPARLVVEYSSTPSFRDVRRVVGPAALADSDYTSRLELTDLPPGQRISYRVRFQDLTDIRTWSETVEGSFVTPPSATAPRDVTIAWSADCVGQGWGISPDWGGLRLYETMRKAQPDIFIHVGDTIYADQPLQREVTLDDGTIWRNVVTEAKSKVAQSLDDYRGNHRYNQLDEHLRRFAGEVSQVWMWDDHEVRDNWYLERSLASDARYQNTSVALLAAHAKRAFFEHSPMRPHPVESERIYRSYTFGPHVEVFALDLRSYRGANSPNVQPTLDAASRLFGADQLAWLKRGLARSRATWKVIASDLPIGVVVPDAPANFEAFANANGGPPLGRELEVAELLRAIKAEGLHNIVWLTADVHYAAAHHYDPSRARFTDFTPFWEFVAGPLHAGTFGPNPMDATFGPEVKFLAIPPGMKPNRPPSAGHQYFGTVTVDARTRALTVKLIDLAGTVLYSQRLDARAK